MNIRDGELTDREQIRAVAEQSFQFSYSLSPQQIETILEGVFASDPLADRIDDPETRFLVAEQAVDGENQVVGFADVSNSTLRWLHVDPDARGQGVGTGLFERVREAVTEHGGELAVRVLRQASEGSEFFTQFGLSRVGTDELEFGAEQFDEVIYVESEGADDSQQAGDTEKASEADQPDEPTVEVPERVQAEGEELIVDQDEEIPGTEAPFFQLSQEQSGGERYGFLCSNCGSTEVTADGLDRLECNECGNKHLADEWDDAYL